MANSTIAANNPALKSWVNVPAGSDFQIQNLPFVVFRTSSLGARIGVRIGDHVLDLKTLQVLGYLENLAFDASDFDTDALNYLMGKGKQATRELRNRISNLLDASNDELQKNTHHAEQVLIPNKSVIMLMPVKIGDYTDFYSSR